MKYEITNDEANALKSTGWKCSDLYIGGRGYVTHLWNAEHTYEASGIDRWYLIR